MDYWSTDALRTQFRIRSADYRELTVWAKDSRIDDLIVSSVPKIGARQLGADVGAGQGRLVRRLSERGERWISIDISEEMLRAGGAPNGIVADAKRLPIRSGALHVLVAQSILPFVPLRSLLEEGWRVLAGGGRVVVADKVLGALVGADAGWYHELERARNPARILGLRTEELVRQGVNQGYTCSQVHEYPIVYSEPLDTWLGRAERIPGSDVARLAELLHRRPRSVHLDMGAQRPTITYTLTWALAHFVKGGEL